MKGRSGSTCGSPGYVAPEVIKGEPYGLEVDMFSLGCVAYVALCGYPPFWGDDVQTIMAKNLKVDFDYGDQYWGNCLYIYIYIYI